MVGAIASLGAALAGIGSLRLAWSGAATRRPWLILSGWALLALALLAFAFAIGGETGIPVAVCLISVAGLGFVVANREVRPRKEARPRGEVIDPSDRASRWWRGAFRVLLAGPLAGTASILVGVALARQLPLSDVDAIAIGGLAVPLLWAGGMAWTLSDDRILRAFGVLVAVSAVSFALAFLI
ncbi:hypothetical protein WNY37_14160 [Henriciella sp. AS95]|uniref:hypothetical protein n=1 Tax=Henriciella sp. AS95 TaxID=3135782 RepID=UPI003180DE16